MFPSSFRSFDGLSLRCYGSPSISPRAQVILVHGLGDHSQSLPYRNLSGFLGEQGFGVYGFDWRGHGQSEGPRMFANAWSDFRNDLHTFVELVRLQAPSDPLFLIGLSLGGLLVLNYTLHHPDKLGGVVAVAPALDTSGVPLLIRLVIPLLSRLVPRASLNPGLDLANISRDPAAVHEYTRDPNFQTRTTPRLAAEVLGAMAETQAQAVRLSLPLLVLHGSADTIVRPAGSARFFERVAISDKERRTYPGAYHNLLIEPNRAQVFADIGRWLEGHS